MSCRFLNLTRGSFLLLLAVAFLHGVILPGSSPALASEAHPAVVRVVVPEGNNTTSYGSGTLVAVSEKTGLILTNWHVVRDRKGQIEVRFPDGFRSAARVLRTDRDWDLAALLVWRPAVDPVRISNRAPRKGEALSIAGYGSGNYRTASGKCVQYLSPGGNKPFEIVELSAGARQGDSGGPILNQHGEMAGVLFGSAKGYTSGSHAVRVRNFLSLIDPQLADGRLAPQVKSSSQTEYAQNVVPAPRVASEYTAQRPADKKEAKPKKKAVNAPAQQVPQKPQDDKRGAWIGVPGNFPVESPGEIKPGIKPGEKSGAGTRVKPAPQWQKQASVQSSESQGSGEGESLSVSNESKQANEANETSDPKASKDLTLWEQVRNVLSLIGGMAILVQIAKLLNPDESKKSVSKGKKKSK